MANEALQMFGAAGLTPQPSRREAAARRARVADRGRRELRPDDALRQRCCHASTRTAGRATRRAAIPIPLHPKGATKMAKYPVIVHGASGYTGMLIMDWLIDQRIPFTAIGRDAERVETNMRERVVRLESAEYEIIEMRARGRGADQGVQRRQDRVQHGRPVRRPRPDRRRGGAGGRLPPPRHHGRAELRPRAPGTQFGAEYAKREPRPAPRRRPTCTRSPRSRPSSRSSIPASTCSRPPPSAAVRARRPASRSGRPRRSSS